MRIQAPLLTLVGLLTLGALDARAADPPANATIDTLITVNGAPITNVDIDAMIMARHQTMDMSGSDEQLLLRLLEKAVRDELILQDALGMGLHEESAFLEPIEEKRMARAIAHWVGESLEDPAAPTSAQIDAHFAEQYRKLQVRQFSLRTKDEAEQVRAQLVKGADWDAMARVMSLDTQSIQGGLHNDKYWLDLEPDLQAAARDLAVGEVSELFPYRESWSMIRVESRTDADPADLEERQGLIVDVLTEAARKEAWEAFLAELLVQHPVTQHSAVLDAIRADAEKVFTGEFFNESSQVALALDAEFQVTESQLRRVVSKLAMEMGTSPFEEMLARALDVESRRLVLEQGATKAGALDLPEVVAAYEVDLREALINGYLNETVAKRIRFDRDEYQAFYDEHKEDFRGAEGVQLSFLFLDTEAQARTVEQRLAAGADFDFVRKEIMGSAHGGEKATWATLDMFSSTIIDAVTPMAVGETSPALAFRERWMIFRLDGRRAGEIPSIENVDTEIRQALFQREFSKLLDAHLDLLEENSEIVRHEERIRRYFAAES